MFNPVLMVAPNVALKFLVDKIVGSVPNVVPNEELGIAPNVVVDELGVDPNVVVDELVAAPNKELGIGPNVAVDELVAAPNKELASNDSNPFVVGMCGTFGLCDDKLDVFSDSGSMFNSSGDDSLLDVFSISVDEDV